MHEGATRIPPHVPRHQPNQPRHRQPHGRNTSDGVRRRRRRAELHGHHRGRIRQKVPKEINPVL